MNPEDPEALAEAIVHVLDEGALRDKMGAKGFERVKQFIAAAVPEFQLAAGPAAKDALLTAADR